MTVCRTLVGFFLSLGLFIGTNFNSLYVCGDYMGVDIGKN